MTPLEGRVAIITGAANGIGRGAAEALAKRGVKSLLVDIDQGGLETVATAIRALGGSAEALVLDLAKEDAPARMEAAALSAFGRIDIVINNVGVLVCGKPEDIPLSEWSRIYELNLMSVVRSAHHFIPRLIAQGSGHIVNTASFAGLFPYAFDRLPYASSKAAIVALSEGLALYLRPLGVGVTCLCPGPVKTQIGKTMKSWTPDLPLRGPGAQFGFREPDAVGEMLADAIERDHFFLATDDQVLDMMQARAADPNAFLARQIAALVT